MEIPDNIIYRLNDKPPFFQCLVISIQHVLSMFVSIVATPLIIAGAINLPAADTAFFISMGLVASGISTFIQVKKIGPVGSGLLSTQGTSYSFLPVFIAAGQSGGLALALGTSFITAPVEAIISRFSKLFRKLFPPEVTGAVVLLIGLILVKVAMANIAGGFGAEDFGSTSNILLGLTVMFVIVALSSIKIQTVRGLAIIIGILTGYIIAIFLGKVSFSAIGSAGWYNIPMPLYFGMKFSPDFILPFIIIYVVTTIESIGDITATSCCSGEPVTGELYEKRVRSGVLGDSVNSMLAAVLNSPPNTTFSQNNGIIQLTGVASRKIGYYIAVILVILGLFPKVAGFIMTIPKPVIGGAMMIIFGIIAGAGIRIIASGSITHRKLIILAVSLSCGLGITFIPEIFNEMPPIIKNFFSSGISTGGLAAVLLNLLLPRDLDKAKIKDCR